MIVISGPSYRPAIQQPRHPSRHVGLALMMSPPAAWSRHRPPAQGITRCPLPCWTQSWRQGVVRCCAALQDGDALANAAYKGRLEEVNELLAAGADVNRPDQDGTPLYNAVVADQLEVVKALLAAGADVEKRGTFTLWTPLYHAALNNQLDVVDALLAAGATVNPAAGYFVKPPLLGASCKGNLKVIQALLAAGADVDATDAIGRTPLFHAAEAKDLRVTKALLAAGARPDIISKTVYGYKEAMAFLKPLLAQPTSTANNSTPFQLPSAAPHWFWPHFSLNSPTQTTLPPSRTQAIMAAPDDQLPPATQASKPPSHQAAQPDTQPAARVCFSSHPSQLPLVRAVAARLADKGVGSFQLPGPSNDPAASSIIQRQCAWFPAARGAEVVVCMVCKEYLKSTPCCQEFNTAMHLSYSSPTKQLVVVLVSGAGDDGDLTTTVPCTADNGPALMYVCQGKRVVTPDVTLVTQEVMEALNRTQQP